MQLARHEVEPPLRSGIPVKNENALTLSMPVYLKTDAALGLKVESLFPNNANKNLPSINGLILLLEAAYFMALRTRAVSALATKYFASE